MTAKAVADGEITDEFLGAFTRRTDEIKRRLRERALSPSLVMRDLQKVVEGTPLMNVKLWLNGVRMGEKSINGYIESLKSIGYKIHTRTEEELLKVQSVQSLYYYADLFKFESKDLELGDDCGNYNKVLERITELGVEVRDIQTGLMMALALHPKTIRFGSAYILWTEPLVYDGEKHLLVVYGNPTPDISLWPIKEAFSSFGFSAEYICMSQPSTSPGKKK